MSQQAIAFILYDGKHAQGTPVLLQISELFAHILHGQNGDLLLKIPKNQLSKQLEWPEITQNGAKIIRFTSFAPPDWQIAQLHLPTGQEDGLRAWMREHLPARQHDGGLVARAQGSWRGVWVAACLLLAVLAAGYTWGLPWAARGISAMIPHSVDETIGKQALSQIDGQWMLPSKLPLDTQTRLREKFLNGVKAQFPQQNLNIRLEFRQSKIGPNAFALPGGLMVMTDELVELVKDDEVVLGVLGHELGHITERHGMRQLVQVTVLQGITSVAFGDYGSLITLAPLALGSMAYSRAHEREADDQSIAYMRASGISPEVMVKFFESVRSIQKNKSQNDKAEKDKAEKDKSPLGFSIISSHPADEERIAKFRAAAKKR